MSCQTSYSCPIIIPTGLPGASVTGANGADGVAVIQNTVGTDYTSSSTGDQSLTTQAITAGLPSAKDTLVVEALFYLSTTFVGEVYLAYGATSTKIATYTISAGDAMPVDPTASNIVVKLTGKIHFKTTATESVEKEVVVYGNPATVICSGLVNIGVDSSSATTVYVRCNPSAGTAVCKYLAITHFKKV